MDPAGDAGQRQRRIKTRVAEEGLAVGIYIQCDMQRGCKRCETSIKSSQLHTMSELICEAGLY